MKVKFQIDYRTEWGQEIIVCGNDPSLGDNNVDNGLRLHPTFGERWEGEVELKGRSDHFEYKYWIVDDRNNYNAEEFGPPRICKVANQRFESIVLRDYWRSVKDPTVELYTSPFLNAFFKRDQDNYKPRYTKTGNYVRFQVRTPRIGKDYSIGIVGGSKSLGNWDESKVVLMNSEDFPVWKADVAVGTKETPFEYKYVIYSHDQEKIVTWENRNNRYLPLQEVTDPQKLTIQTDEDFKYPVGNWKAAGVAIPVFSLRSENGTGVGEFLDIKPMVDWAVKTGMKMVQILPVNDTIATHTWVDSYPYAAISVHALHPIYANLQAFGKVGDSGLQKEIAKERKRLNSLPDVDYETVMKVKSRFFKVAYDQEKDKVLSSKQFKEFFKSNCSWLVPYAAFSALRDRYGTPDFTQWDGHAIFDRKKIDKLVSENGKDFDDIAIHYFIQFHLHNQLMEAAEYARSHGVVLKGDIPIGIYRNSVDAWMLPELFNMDCQAGAPPDDFSISGQNWGFPTYNWQAMAQDGFKWWKDRLVKMSEYFDVFRIDHILGFFRIWEIPWEHVEGIMGRFNPALPVHLNEFGQWGIYFDRDRFCKPYIRHHMIKQLFNNHSDMIIEKYLHEYAPGCYELQEYVNTQRKVKIHFDQLDCENPESKDFNFWIRVNLYRLLAEVLFLEAPLSNGEAFNPRIALHSTYSYQELDEHSKQKIDELYNHFFYHRHNDFWADSAMQKLPALKAATDMLICGEDLGMVPACVPGVMEELSILSLAIQRMPNDDRGFWHPSDTPYNSVTSTGSHDMSTLREWWQEDADKSQRFYNTILGHWGGAPYFCEPWVACDIINQHMHSPSMWAIFPIQDLLAMDSSLRREIPEEERINVPSIAQHYWRYRFHITMENLLNEDGFNGFVRELVDHGGRRADY